MAARNLYRQARPFRYLGYLLLAAVVAGSSTHLGTGQLIAALLFCLLGPPAMDIAQRHGGGGDIQTQRLQTIENFLAPALLSALNIPAPLVFAVVACLANANVALGGGRSLPRVFVALGSGWLLGATIASQLTLLLRLPASAAIEQEFTWWIAGAMLLAFSLALSDVGFRLTQRLDGHRHQWRERVQLLQRFVPPGLPAQPDQLERRWLTVCVVDLVNFTARSASLPPETVATVLDDLLDTVVLCANRCGGTLDKFTGDGALVFFSAASRETGARASVRFGLLLVERLAVLNGRWLGYGVLEGLQLRTGIASGFCSLGEWGTQDVRAYTLIGGSVALAERLQCNSEVNSMLLCAVTTRLISLVADCVATDVLPQHLKLCIGSQSLEFARAEFELKGFGRVRAYRLSAKVPTPAST
jgi:class 3 adenylate cyclase